ncbi:MAG: tetratricopeptide repeat protein [Planctomycetes bacterium]|nr:tetratricopeptide repeat protein [Planctomycetota bacterium]
MTADFDIARQLFEQALERSPAERDSFLDDACGEDEGLRARVSELLASLDAAGEFLVDVEPPSVGSSERRGGVVGRYKLLQQIGEGGFGTVWMAEQQDPVRRRVALKVIKLGMDTRQVVARFEAERQALALMDHPNIAKVFDGGITPGGRPYFVMELINGVPITDYCDQAELALPQRLELIQQVCYAVQHAHQKGVIHRDVKPSNILVTLHDGVPVPKVIDFGVAKATSAELTQRTMFTEFRQMVGTPDYMAPEQAELSGLDVDTRADVYSIGVVLYELLTGTKPFESRSLLEKGYQEMLRVIREDTPDKPSTRVSTLGGQLVAMAAHRHTTPGSLGRSMRGDLDWIVMKALEKDRSRRYATANDFAADIGRHLQDEPVLASPPGVVYRLRKYVRRHRVAVSAGSMVAMALIAGLAAATWGWFEADAQRVRALKAEDDAIGERDAARSARERAEAERQEAEMQANRAEAVTALVQEMLESANPSRNRGRDYTVRELLDEFSDGLGDKLAKEPEVEASLRAIMAKAYLGLGSYEKAASHAEIALAKRRQVLDAEHPAIAGSLVTLAGIVGRQGRLGDAESMLREALTICRTRGDDGQSGVAETLRNLSEVLMREGKLEEAEATSREALDLHCRLFGDDNTAAVSDRVALGAILEKRGKLEEAESTMRQALETSEGLFGHEHLMVASSLHGLAWVLQRRGKVAEAEPLAREALRMNRKLLGDAHPDVANSLTNLAGCLAEQRKWSEAEAMYREALDLHRAIHGDQHTSIAVDLSNLGQVLMSQGKSTEAVEMQRQALRMRRELLGGDQHTSIAIGLDNLAKSVMARGDFEQAEPLFREALEIRESIVGDRNPDIVVHLHNLGHCLVGQEKWMEAESVFRRELDLIGDRHPRSVAVRTDIARMLGKQGRMAEADELLGGAAATWAPATVDSAENAINLDNRSGLYFRQGRLPEAEAASRESLAMKRRLWGDDSPGVAFSHRELAWNLFHRGDYEASEAEYREAVAGLRRWFGDDHAEVIRTVAQLGGCLAAHGKYPEAEPHYRQLLAQVRAGRAASVTSLDIALARLGSVLLEQGKYAEAEPVLRECLAIRTEKQLMSLDSALAGLGSVLLEQGKYAEAEPVLRECLAIRTEKQPDSWLRYNAMSLLGEVLLGEGRYAEAEPLLLEGYENMDPPAEALRRGRKIQALERIVELYGTWGKPEEAERWRLKLAAERNR